MSLSRISLAVRGCVSIGLLSGFFFLSGCAKPTGNLSGKVSYKGTALKGGNVALVNTEGKTVAASSIEEDGSYSIANVVVGEYTVCVETTSLKPRADADGYGTVAGGGAKGGKGAGAPMPKGAGAPPEGAALPDGYKASNPAEVVLAKAAKRYVQIPDTYGESTKSDLRYTVVAGDQSHNVELK